MAPVLLGTGIQKQHPYLYWEFHEGKGSKQAVRFGNWKAVSFLRDNRIELYNLESDPREQKGLSAQHGDILKEAQKLMREARTPSQVWPLRAE